MEDEVMLMREAKTATSTRAGPSSAGSRIPSRGPRGGRCRFLTSHARLLMAVARRPDARIRDLAAELHLTQRTTQRIVRELEEEGFLRVERRGRRNRYVLAGRVRRASREARDPLTSLPVVCESEIRGGPLGPSGPQRSVTQPSEAEETDRT